jgi:hypothetical protein
LPVTGGARKYKIQLPGAGNTNTVAGYRIQNIAAGCQLPGARNTKYSYRLQVSGYREYRIQLPVACYRGPGIQNTVAGYRFQVTGNTEYSCRLPVTGYREYKIQLPGIEL